MANVLIDVNTDKWLAIFAYAVQNGVMHTVPTLPGKPYAKI